MSKLLKYFQEVEIMGNKNSTPKRKRLDRKERLKKASLWIKNYKGKKIVSGYAKWFGVEFNARRNQKKVVENNELIESDENFAVIVGYTSGGAPYGLTHEEYEEIKHRDSRLLA